jgi:hypothetical protein
MLKGHAFVLAAGAALIALDASASMAQDTTHARPRSTKRISVKKESGEVAPMPRVDTVTIFRTDTLSLTRIDTVTMTNTVVRTDTLVQTITRPIPASGNWYGGLAAGVAVPAGGLQNLNETGGTGQLQFGWQPVHSVLGGRIDASYSRFRRPFGFSDNNFAIATPLFGFTNVFSRQSNVWNFNANLKVQVPGVEGLFGHAVTFSPYLIGGGGFATYDNLPMEFSDGSFLIVRDGIVQTTNGIIINGVTVDNFDTGWHTSWGWNAGGGLAWRFGHQELFVESRVLGYNTNRGDFFNNTNITGIDLPRFRSARQVPIVFGMNWY